MVQGVCNIILASTFSRVPAASRMESAGFPMCVHVSEATRRRLGDVTEWIDFGAREIKGAPESCWKLSQRHAQCACAFLAFLRSYRSRITDAFKECELAALGRQGPDAHLCCQVRRLGGRSRRRRRRRHRPAARAIRTTSFSPLATPDILPDKERCCKSALRSR